MRIRVANRILSGSVRIDLTNPDWTEKTPYEEERDIPRLDAIDEVYSATLGGPILRDRLWFFAAGRLLETTMAQTLPETGARVNTVTDNPRWEVKLTGNIASNHTLQASYLDNEETNLDRPSVPGSTADIRAVDRARTLPNTRWAASYHGVWTPRLFFELKYSEKEFGAVMGFLMGKAKGRVDGKIVQEKVRARLGGTT